MVKNSDMSKLFSKINDIQKARHFIYTKNSLESDDTRFDRNITISGNEPSYTLGGLYLDLQTVNSILSKNVMTVEAIDPEASLITDNTGNAIIKTVTKNPPVCLFEPYSGGPYTNIDEATYTTHQFNPIDNVVKGF